MESVMIMSKNDKLCGDCKTSKTPLWRTGPAGPKSLCNACGIRYRKKRGVIGSDKKKEKSPPPSPTASTVAGIRKREIDGGGEMMKSGLRIEVVALRGKEVVLLQRRRSPVKRRKTVKDQCRKFGEVEEAAFVLMSLSCGLVFG
ncbi:hypothetical protein R6Q57_008313 [Mikania cordata]